ncbi:MAG: TonB-dependent receptor [Alphaproteobacteria bacterium]|nr:TonB-dependent receptor [Alphaproteobacteria bacterium]
MTMSRHASLYLSASAFALLCGHGAFGQAAAPAATPEGVPEQVIVTGSLLGAANFAAPTPVTQVSGVQVQTRALTGVGTVIEQLPFAQPGSGLTRNTNGIIAAAQSLPNLRGLGATDTLVLIDGMRPTPVNATNGFDTDMIPQSLLDRFEVVTTGASATYGSDAVAGVVNFILKDHLEGFTSDARAGTSQRGDENQTFVSAAYGTALLNGRGHFVIGGEFANEYNTATLYARAWGRREPFLVSLPASTAKALGLPFNVFSNNAEVDNGTEGGLIAACLNNATNKAVPCPAATQFTANINGNTAGATTFDSSGNPHPFQLGSVVGGSYMIGSTANYGASSLNRQLSPPYKRWAGLARFEYDVTPNITAFAMVNYGELESDDPSQGTPFPLFIKVPSGNPFIPASIQALMTANGVQAIQLNKETPDGIHVGDTAQNKNILVQSFFGFKGTLFNDWNWDLEGSAGRANIWQEFLDVPIAANLDLAMNGCQPLTSDSQVTYLNPGNGVTTAAQVMAQATSGCQPYNPFGVAPAGALNYITNIATGPDGSETNLRQYMGQADLAGPLFNLPAGPLAFAVGGNYRYNSIDQRGTIAAVEAVYSTLNPGSYFESQSVYEAYSEIGVPVVRDLPFIKAIDLNAAGRYTNYSITGGVWTWKYGGTWDVTDWLRLRATRSQDIRAPNFRELSVVPTTSATNLQNPITGVSQRLSDLFTTGNPNLQPEVSQNVTGGVVLQPTPDAGPIVSGFRASVDYYRIRISGQITTVAPQDVINRCLLQHLPVFCNQINFDPGLGPDSFTPTSGIFGITGLHLLDVNLNSEIQDGVDINISQRIPLDGAEIPGTLQFSALGSYINQQTTYQSVVNSNGSVTVKRTNYADATQAPRWSWNVNLTYLLDAFTANLQMRYYSPIRFLQGTAFNIGPDDPNYSPSNPLSINRAIWPAAITWNLALSYDLIQEPDGQDLQVYFNIDNLLDKDPPIIWWYVSNYDVVGRYFKLGVRYTLP